MRRERGLLLAASAAGIFFTGIALREWTKVVYENTLDRAHARAAEEHRRFLRRLDHELKNPLTAIQVGLANLAETDDVEAQKRIRANIQTQVQRLSHLATDLRKLAELESAPLEEYPIHMGDMLREVLTMAQETPGAETRHFYLDIEAEELPTVTGDRDLLQLAVYNLLDNAVKFTHAGDSITLRIYSHEGSVVVGVSDTGQGIPQEDQPHVWEELYRSSEARSAPGKGIGLAMVRGIIERHNGEIGLESEIGRGTTVTLKLPAGS